MGSILANQSPSEETLTLLLRGTSREDCVSERKRFPMCKDDCLIRSNTGKRLSDICSVNKFSN